MSHHATEDLAVMRSLPNLKILSPSGLWETQEATKALARSKGPGFLRLDKSYGKDILKLTMNLLLVELDLERGKRLLDNCNRRNFGRG